MKAHDEIEEEFPLLRNSHGIKYTITSCKNGCYNCLAWAVGDISEKWDSVLAGLGYYWPPGVGRDDTPDQWADIFVRYHGYELLGTPDTSHEVGFEKVAIYATHDGVDGARHAARQLQNGCWSSKLGDGADIEHQDVAYLEGELYGQVMRVVRRPRRDWMS